MPVNEGLAELSDTLLLIAVLCYAVAMIGYAAELAFGRRTPDVALPTIAGGAIDTMPVSWAPAHSASPGAAGLGAAVGKAAVALTALGWLVHAASLTTRGLAVERVPWGNMYEFSSAVCLAAVTGFLYLMTRQQVRHLGAVVMLPVVVYLGIAGTILYAPASPLVPALNSYWLKIHVAAAAIATGVFMIGFTTTLLYLVQDARERRRGTTVEGVSTGAVAVRPGRLPSAASLDAVAYKVTAFAFPIWTFAVIAGAVWAEAAWGRYWGWDPKETWAFITFVLYAGYLHARALPRWQGRRAAGVGVLAFVALMFCYFGVNLWISGLHSYAGV